MSDVIHDTERELGRSASLLGEVVDGRARGDRDECAGHSDNDLLAAVEELEDAIKAWRRADV